MKNSECFSFLSLDIFQIFFRHFSFQIFIDHCIILEYFLNIIKKNLRIFGNFFEFFLKFFLNSFWNYCVFLDNFVNWSSDDCQLRYGNWLISRSCDRLGWHGTRSSWGSYAIWRTLINVERPVLVRWGLIHWLIHLVSDWLIDLLHVHYSFSEMTFHATSYWPKKSNSRNKTINKSLGLYYSSRELLLEYSVGTAPNVITMLLPRKSQTATFYLSILHALTCDMPPTLLIRGTQEDILTFYC